ncbi:MAG: META domain-containing protein [Clostridiales bacterium]|nr:META domain-containing protein [Clostridiales bacterium]
MKKTMLIGSVMLATAAITSCTTTRNMPVSDLSGEWNVVSIQDTAVTLTPPPYLAFDVVNSRIFGNAGCNRILGALYATDNGTIDLSGIGATRMMCPDMAIEDKLLTALNQVERFGVDKDEMLVLMDKQGDNMVTLSRKADAISPSSLVGSWKVNLLGNLELGANAEGDYTIEFLNDGTFSMTTGCNNVGGNYAGRYVDIAFTQLMSTRMACPNMEVETEAQKVLPTVVSFGQLENGNFGFYNADNDLVMTISAME